MKYLAGGTTCDHLNCDGSTPANITAVSSSYRHQHCQYDQRQQQNNQRQQLNQPQPQPLQPLQPHYQYPSDMKNDHAKSHDTASDTTVKYSNTATITATMIESTPLVESMANKCPDLARHALEGSDLSSVESELLESDSDIDDAKRMTKKLSRKSPTETTAAIAASSSSSSSPSTSSPVSSSARKNSMERQMDALFGTDDSSFSAISSLSESDDHDEELARPESFTSNQRRNTTLSYGRARRGRRKQANSNGIHGEPFKYESSDSSESIHHHQHRRQRSTDSNQRHGGGVFTEDESDGNSMDDTNHSVDSTICSPSGSTKMAYTKYSSTSNIRRKTDTEATRPNQRDRSGRTPIFRCISSNDLNGLKRWLGMGADVNARDHAGWTPIHEACIYGNLDIVRCIIESHANVNATGKNGDTPLHDAARRGWQDVVEVLLQAGANPDIANKKGQRPVDVCGQYPAIRNYLARRLRLQNLTMSRDRAGQTMLHRACSRNRIADVLDLLNCGASVEACDYAGWTPLHEAALEGHVGIVKLLLANGANANAKGHGGDTSLHDASQNGHISVVKLLIEHGADPRIKNEAGQRPIDVANDSQITELLRKSSKTWKKSIMDKKGQNTTMNTDSDFAQDNSMSSTKLTRTRLSASLASSPPSSICSSPPPPPPLSLPPSSSSPGPSTNGRFFSIDSNSMKGLELSDTGRGNRSEQIGFHRRLQSLSTVTDVIKSDKRSSLGKHLMSKDDDDEDEDDEEDDDNDEEDDEEDGHINKKMAKSKKPRHKPRTSRSQSPHTHTTKDNGSINANGQAPLSREERKMQQLMATIRRLEERDEKKRRRRLHSERSASPQTHVRSDHHHLSRSPPPPPTTTTTTTQQRDTVSLMPPLSLPPSPPSPPPIIATTLATAGALSSTTLTSTHPSNTPTPIIKRKPGRPRRISQTSLTTHRRVNSSNALTNKLKCEEVSKTVKGRVQELNDMDRRARHRDSSGRTALHRRAKKADLDSARQLLAHGADVNCRDNAGWSPLHEAALAGHADMVQLLLSHGANVSVQAENLDTPLHDAAEAGYVQVVRLLLDAGASPDVKNEQGMTPLDLVDVDAIKDVDERRIAKEIRELLNKALRSQNRRSKSELESKRVAGDDAAMSDASNTSLRRKRRLVSGRQLASRRYDDDDDDEINDDRHIKVKSQEKKKRDGRKRQSKTPESSLSTNTSTSTATHTAIRHAKRTSVVVKQEEEELNEPLLFTKMIPPVKVKREPLTDHTTAPLPLKARFFPPSTIPRLDMAHAKRFLPLYTVQLDTTTSYTNGHGLLNTDQGGHNAFFVIDLQVHHLLDLPQHLSLFARYPDLQRRSVGQREKERFWGPLAYMLMANGRSGQVMPAHSTLQWKEQEKRRFLSTDIYFVRLDDVASLIRRDYPYLSEQLITIKLDLGFSDDIATNALRSNNQHGTCTEDSMALDTLQSPLVSTTTTTTTATNGAATKSTLPPPTPPTTMSATFSLPAKFAMKLNKQLNTNVATTSTSSTTTTNKQSQR